MAECFCGCGRSVGAFQTTLKSANKMGRTIRDTLGGIDNSKSKVPPHVAETLKMDAKRVEGERYLEQCREVVHEDRDFKGVNWPAARDWVRDAQGMNKFFTLSPEQQQAIIRRG